MRYDGRHFVGLELAPSLIEAAQRSVGQHHGPAYRVQVQYFCEDLDLLRRRLRELDRDIERKLDEHEVGRLLTTIDGIGTQTAARLIADARRSRRLPQRRRPRRLRRRRPRAQAVGQAQRLPRGHDAHRQRPPARRSLDAHADRRTQEPLAARPTTSACAPRGKLPKVALVACMRKLLLAVYSVAKHRRPFVPKLAAKEAAT